MSYDRQSKKRSSMNELFRELFQGRGKDATLAILFFIFKASPLWVMPIFTARMIDLIAYEGEDRVTWLLVYSGALMLLLLQNIPCQTLHTIYISRISRGIGSNLRVRLCRQLQRLTLLYHNRTSVGKLQAKAIRDIELLENIPNLFVQHVFQFCIQVGIAITAIALRAPAALLFFVIVVPVAGLLRSTFHKILRENVREYRRSIEGMSSSLNDMMTMIPVTRAHGLEGKELQSVKSKITHVFDQGRSFDKVRAVFGSSAWVTMNVLQILFLTGLIYVCFHGKITVGDVVMFNSFFLVLSNQMTGLLNILPQLTLARESMHSIMEVLHAPDRENNAGKPVFENIQGEFDFQDVSFHYPDTRKSAIKHFSLHVPAGESVALVGPSGSGKSTLLSLLLGFVRPDSGRILLDGNDMKEMDLRSYRQHVGVVTQDSVFFSGTVKENVAYGQENISEDEVMDALRMANALDFIEELPEGIETRMGVDGIKLSGGQQQRLAIARAIIRNPKVLILDEATSALDTESELLVQEAIEHIMRGRTTFIVAHRVSTVRNADRIVILDQGTISEIDSPEELLKRDNFYSRAVKQMQAAIDVEQ